MTSPLVLLALGAAGIWLASRSAAASVSASSEAADAALEAQGLLGRVAGQTFLLEKGRPVQVVIEFAPLDADRKKAIRDVMTAHPEESGTTGVLVTDGPGKTLVVWDAVPVAGQKMTVGKSEPFQGSPGAIRSIQSMDGLPLKLFVAGAA